MNQVLVVNLDKLEKLDLPVHKVKEENQDSLVLLVYLDHRVFEENLDREGSPDKEENLVAEVNLDQLDHLDHLD